MGWCRAGEVKDGDPGPAARVERPRQIKGGQEGCHGVLNETPTLLSCSAASAEAAPEPASTDQDGAREATGRREWLVKMKEVAKRERQVQALCLRQGKAISAADLALFTKFVIFDSFSYEPL